MGPILPMKASLLANQLKGLIDKVYIDKMNYCSKVMSIYRDYNLEYALTDQYFEDTIDTLTEIFRSHCVTII